MKKTAIALGFFDGVHLGHQRILRETAALAARQGLQPAAVTFENQPRAFLTQKPAALLTPGPLRRELILQQGIECVHLLPFDARMAQMPAEDFVRDVLLAQYGCGAVVCGENYTFGARGSGDGRLLERLGRAWGFDVQVCPPVVREQRTVSSSWIRELVAAGDIGRARALLGHDYVLRGTVIHGRGVGRKLGFPTGNIELHPDLLPPRYGVYAAWLRTGAGVWPAAINIGVRPTFGLTRPVVEFNILDFSGDLYDAEVELSLVEFIRAERAFGTAAALTDQIARDVARVKEILQ